MYLKNAQEKPIAILGAGGVGKTLAGDSKLGGAKEVRLWEQETFAKKNFVNIERGITITGGQYNYYSFERAGIAQIDMVSTNMAEVVKGAGNICITTVAPAHEHIFRELIPLLEDGQIIHLFPDNYGTFLLRKMMREMNCTAKVIVGGWATAPYGTRIQIRGGVTSNTCRINDRVTFLRGAALPASDTETFLASAKFIPGLDACTTGDGYQVADTVVDTNLSNVNPVIHVPGTVLAVSTMENFGTVLGQYPKNYSLYAFGLCPSIAQVQSVFWEEEKAIAKAMEVGICTVNYEDFFSRTTMYGKEYMGPDFAVPFEDRLENFYGDGPFDLENRYITEDVPVGCYIYQQLARKYNVPTPIIDCMILLANTMIKRDLTANSKYTLAYLGIDHMNHEQLQKYLREGLYTEA